MAQVLLELCKLTVNRNGKAHEDSGKFRDLFWASDPSRSELQNLIGLDIFWSNPTTLEHEMLNCWTCMKNILIKATWALYIETYMLDQQKILETWSLLSPPTLGETPRQVVQLLCTLNASLGVTTKDRLQGCQEVVGLAWDKETEGLLLLCYVMLCYVYFGKMGNQLDFF